jgi:hypothetical protein
VSKHNFFFSLSFDLEDDEDDDEQENKKMNKMCVFILWVGFCVDEYEEREQGLIRKTRANKGI